MLMTGLDFLRARASLAHEPEASVAHGPGRRAFRCSGVSGATRRATRCEFLAESDEAGEESENLIMVPITWSRRRCGFK